MSARAELAERTALDLLTERRLLIKEQMREPNEMARAILQFSVDEIDRELARRRSAVATVKP